MAQSAVRKRTPLGIEPVLGKTKLRSPSQLGEVPDTGEVGLPSQRKHQFGHSTWFSTRTRITPTRTDLRKHNSRISCSIGNRNTG